jgi:hypothetical protein
MIEVPRQFDSVKSAFDVMPKPNLPLEPTSSPPLRAAKAAAQLYR